MWGMSRGLTYCQQNGATLQHLKHAASEAKLALKLFVLEVRSETLLTTCNITAEVI